MAPHPLWLREWERLVVNRSAPYAVQQGDGSYRWVRDRLTCDTLLAHLEGRITLAIATMEASGLCRWVCLDADAADGLPKLIAMRLALEQLGWVGTLEASRRGGHLWFFFHDLVPARLVRVAIQAALTQIAAQGVALTPVEIYPKSDDAYGVGSPIRLPLGVHRRTGKQYAIIAPNGAPMHFSSLPSAVNYIGAITLRPAWLRSTYGHLLQVPPKLPPPIQGGKTHSAVIRWVDAEAHPLDLLDTYAPASSMRRVGKGYLGWCPFHDDAAPQVDGTPGTPSFSVVYHQGYGWSWRCFSTNCRYEALPMKHSFELFCALQGLDVPAGIQAARQCWPHLREKGGGHERD